MDEEKPLKQIYFNFSDGITPSGESLSLITDFFDSGEEIYCTQVLTLMCYGNSACFNLGNSPLIPEKLRKLADLIENTTKDLEKKRRKNGL